MQHKQTLAQQEDHLFRVLSSERFLNMEGLGNEVAHFIYDYDPTWALDVAQAKKRIKTKLDTERGIKVFDYGRSKRDTGAFDFKTNWGFEPEQLFYEYYLVRRKDMPNLSPSNPRFGAAIRLWQHLPIRVTQVVGPHVAKYLG